MDSMMIAAHPQRSVCLKLVLQVQAHIRKLTLLELIYSYGAIMAVPRRKDGRDDLIAGMEHYLDPNDFNKRFYHATGEGSRSEACLKAGSASMFR